MKPAAKQVLRWIYLFLLVALVSDCSKKSAPITYYTLSPTDRANAKSTPPPHMRGFSLGIGPITLPKYLERSKIVIRKTPNRIVVSEFHRWAGSLKNDLQRVLSANLFRFTGIEQIVSYPWRSGKTPDYGLEIEVRAFDAIPNDSVTLIAFWMLTPTGKTAKKSVSRLLTVKIELGAGDIESIVAAKSQAVERLSQDVAEALKRI